MISQTCRGIWEVHMRNDLPLWRGFSLHGVVPRVDSGQTTRTRDTPADPPPLNLRGETFPANVASIDCPRTGAGQP